MIITCASCLTKFYLDDSKISTEGVKVRCSRCKHVFFVSPPAETKEEIIEDFEAFAKYHEELMEPDKKEADIPSPLAVEEREKGLEEEPLLSSEKISAEEEAQEFPTEQAEETADLKAMKPKRMVQKERRGPSLFFIVLVIFILSAFGFFYLWTESGDSGNPRSFLEYPIKRLTEFWMQIWGTEKKGLIVRDLNGYEEKIGEIPIFVIEGKVNNQSQFTKKYIKIKVAIFSQNRDKLAEKETFCGRVISQEELRSLPAAFLKGEMVIRPKADKDMITPHGQAIPFLVVFKNLSNQAKEFQVEIVEAPHL